MQGVMVDTSVWVSYFRNGPESEPVADALDYLLADGEVVVDEIILWELLPFMRLRGEAEAEEALLALSNPPLAPDWPQLRQWQEQCLRHGVNKVGIPDLLIAQHAKALGVPLFSLDRHFSLMAPLVGLRLWPDRRVTSDERGRTKGK